MFLYKVLIAKKNENTHPILKWYYSSSLRSLKSTGTLAYLAQVQQSQTISLICYKDKEKSSHQNVIRITIMLLTINVTHPITTLKDKNHMMTSINKSIQQNPTFLCNKSKKLEIERSLMELIKGIYEKHKVLLYLMIKD